MTFSLKSCILYIYIYPVTFSNVKPKIVYEGKDKVLFEMFYQRYDTGHDTKQTDQKLYIMLC